MIDHLNELAGDEDEEWDEDGEAEEEEEESINDEEEDIFEFFEYEDVCTVGLPSDFEIEHSEECENQWSENLQKELEYIHEVIAKGEWPEMKKQLIIEKEERAVERERLRLERIAERKRLIAEGVI